MRALPVLAAAAPGLTGRTGRSAELCVGIPLSAAGGAPILARAGMFFSF